MKVATCGVTTGTASLLLSELIFPTAAVVELTMPEKGVHSELGGKNLGKGQNRNVCSDFGPDLWYLDPVRLPELVTLSLKIIDDNDINDNKLVAAAGVCHSRHCH